MIHSIHPYPCKFPSTIADKYLEPTKNFLDPFCGSGTSLLEAARKGMEVYGFDCNPIAGLISRCKLVNLRNTEIVNLEKFAKQALQVSFESIDPNLTLHSFHGRDHWFSEEVQREFAFLLEEIDDYDRDSNSWVVLATVLSAITVAHSKQDSETRYVAVEKKHSRGDVIVAFAKKLDRVTRAIRARGPLPNNNRQVFLGDIRQGMPIEDNSISQVITSPPYANTMDYYLYHKQRMNILGFDFKKTQSQEIGSRYEFSSKKESKETWNRDYEIGLREVARVLENSGRAIYIIGDSQIAGELVDGAKLTTEVAKSIGLSCKVLESIPMAGRSRTFNHSYQRPNKFEHVVEVRK